MTEEQKSGLLANIKQTFAEKRIMEIVHSKPTKTVMHSLTLSSTGDKEKADRVFRKMRIAELEDSHAGGSQSG